MSDAGSDESSDDESFKSQDVSDAEQEWIAKLEEAEQEMGRRHLKRWFVT